LLAGYFQIGDNDRKINPFKDQPVPTMPFYESNDKNAYKNFLAIFLKHYAQYRIP
jgi:hypothetical protein